MRNLHIETSAIHQQPLLTRAEVAHYLGVCKETIRRWEKEGRLAAIVINARVYRYRLSDVESFLSNCGS